MNLRILFAQRKESYEGEFAPEALCCWTEYQVEENPEGFEQACREAEAACGDDLVATKLISVSVDGDKIRGLLVGMPKITGHIVTERPLMSGLPNGELCRHSAQSWSGGRRNGTVYCDDCRAPIKQAADGFWYRNA